MEDYRWNYHVPAFGSWDYEDDNMPYTQCFETARTQQQHQQQGGSYGRYGGYTEVANVEERDLYSYVTGDLYQHDFVTPAVIVVPRRRRKGETGYTNVKGVKKQQQVREKQQEWSGYSYDIKEPPSPIVSPPKPKQSKSKAKAIDEDLYKIPPEYLHVKPKRKKGFGLFSSCLLPACA